MKKNVLSLIKINKCFSLLLCNGPKIKLIRKEEEEEKNDNKKKSKTKR